MFLTERKLEARLNELEEYRYRDRIHIPSFLMDEDEGEIGAYPYPPTKQAIKMKLGDRWEGRDVYKWLQTSVRVPAEWSGKKIVGRFRFGRTGGGTNSGFESLLFVNGTAFQGVDSNHEEVLFPKDCAGEKLDLSFRMWTGLEGGGQKQILSYRLDQAELTWLDESVDDLYYTGIAMFQAIKELPESDPNRVEMQDALEKAMNEIDWTIPGSELFYQSCADAGQQLRTAIEGMEKKHPVTIHCLGHTHIDVAWLWRLVHTREKAARSFSTVLRLMEAYPDYLFLQTQPQLYAYLKEDYPEIYEQLKERVAQGQWEVEGSMWLEADCNIPSGESLVRQLTVGKRFIKEEFEKDCSVLWLPDVFGYSWALPQILQKAGITSFMTTKISWNQYNRMPHDTFYWRGIDGTDLLTHFITTPEPWNEEDSWFYTYNGLLEAKTVNGAWKGYRDKSVNKELLLSYGYGDGGGGVNREMLEMRRRLDELPGIPQVKPGRAGDFFQKLEQTVSKSTAYVHRWDGELYLEYHRGTYTSQAFMKRENRKLEFALRSLELKGIQQAIATKWEAYPVTALKEAWMIVLRNQFHDIIPGSSIHEVYEDAKREYKEAWNWIDEAENELSAEATGYSVSKEDHYRLPQLITINAGVSDQAAVYIGGKQLKTQKIGNQIIALAPDLPSFSISELTIKEQQHAKKESVFCYGDNKLETPYYNVEWNQHGQFVSLFDKVAGRQVLPEGAIGNAIQIFEDKPLAHDAWDIDLFYQNKAPDFPQLLSTEVAADGSLQFVLRMSYMYNRSTFEQKIVFYTHTKRIDFRTKVRWHEQRKLVKAAFPISVRATEATYDIQFGNVKRPTHWNTSWDMAKFETVGHQWADLAETGYGVSLLNDCKYGYDIKENTMRLTLLKGAMYPDTEADQGNHEFTYARYPHEGCWREAGTKQEAWDLNVPLVAKKEHGFPQLVSCNASHIHIDTIKKADERESVVVRLHEFEGRSGTIELEWKVRKTAWREVNLLEEPIGQLQRGPILLEIKPYEIKTIEVQM